MAAVSALAAYRAAGVAPEGPGPRSPRLGLSVLPKSRRGQKRALRRGPVNGEQQPPPGSPLGPAASEGAAKRRKAGARPKQGGPEEGGTQVAPQKGRKGLESEAAAAPLPLQKGRRGLAGEGPPEAMAVDAPLTPQKRRGGLEGGGPLDAMAAGAPLPPKKGRQALASEGPPEAMAKGEHPSPQRPLVCPSLQGLLQELGQIQHSRLRASRLFEWLIAPVSPQQFFQQYWEKKPLLIHRRNPGYYQGLFSTADFDTILRDHHVQFGVNLDVTSYEGGKRETHNPVGRAVPAVVWDFYRNGCSLRMLNPQAFSSTVWHVLSILQEQFGSMVGANTYLTPAGTQGFAPHYDDIEAFVVQLEGKKHWQVYNPRSEAEVLPRFSSNNFDQEEIGEPMLETVLEAGDLLYFPRGFIHQGDCLPDAHSLHITLSSYQRNSWGDLLEKLLPAALHVATEEDVAYRQGLPVDYLEYMGGLHSDVADDPRRAAFMQKVRTLINKLLDYAPVDAAVDQKAKDFLHDCLPPVLTEKEKALSVYGLPARWEEGQVKDLDVPIKKKTQVRLLRYGIVRLCSEGDGVLLYYSTENSRVYHKEEPKYCEIEPEYTNGVEFLLSSYPKYVTVEALPCTTLEDKIALATVLFEKGLLITKNPLSV